MKNIFDISKKTFILTGSTGHLGKPLANYLESNGANIIRVSRSEEESDNSYKLDITNDAEKDNFINFIHKNYQFVDGIINNAYSGNTGVLFNTKREEFEQSLDIILTSPFLLIQSLIPFFNKGSSIVNISSMYGIVSPDPRIYGESGQNNPIYYGAGKAGLIQFTKYLACHLPKKEIRVNSISPGPFPNLKSNNTNETFKKELEKKVPLGRIGKPEDLFGLIHFLLSDSSSYINGANIPIDGGWTAW